MWLTVKQASRAKGRGRQAPVPVNPTTLGDLEEYNALKAEFPDVEAPSADMYGAPDQIAHLELLRRLKREQTETPQQQAKPGLPTRDPGFFTSPESQSREYGVPPMPRRTPGDSLKPSHGPGYAPEQQSYNDWLKWLGDRGIFLDSDGRRLQPRQPYVIDNHDIWAPFIDRSGEDPDAAALRDLPEIAGGLGKSWRQRAKELFGTRRASTTITSYIDNVLLSVGGEEVVKVASRVHDALTGDGWTHHESGSGEWYEKPIGDKLHRIVREPDGWIHNSGPVDGERDEYGDLEMTGMPIMFDDLQGALMHANRGRVQVGFRPPPPHQQSLSANSWSD